MPVAPAGAVPLGALQPSTARSVLVVSTDGELAVALRERIEPWQALIRDVRRGEVERALGACKPFPFMVVGDENVPPAVTALARAAPVIVLWRGTAQSCLPRHCEQFDRFSELLDVVERALSGVVAGISLSPGEGVEMADGAVVSSAHLQALVAAHPRGVELPAAAVGRVSDLLGRHRSAVRLVRSSDQGWGLR